MLPIEIVIINIKSCFFKLLKPMHYRSIKLIFLILLAGAVSLFAATATFDAVSGTGANNAWTASGATVGDDCSALGGTASSTATESIILEVPIANTAGQVGIIDSITVRVAGYASVVKPGNGAYIRIYANGTTASSSALFTFTASYAYYSADWPTNPATSSAWTWSDIDALVAGAISNRQQNWPTWYIDHVQVIVNYTAPPEITGLSAAANATGEQLDSSTVNIYYEVSHEDYIVVNITAEYQVGGAGSWTALQNMTGDTGTVEANSPNTDRTIVWDMLPQVGSNVDSSFLVRIIVEDSASQYDTVITSSYVIDTRDPTGLADFTVTDSGCVTADLQWTTVTEAHFSHYEIWFGTSLTNVQERNISAYEWDEDNDAALSIVTTDTTTVMLLEYLTKYYFKIWAIDSSGNEMTTAVDSTTTLTSADPLVTGWDPNPNADVLQYNTDSVYIGYEVMDNDDDTATVYFDMQLKDGPWTLWSTMKSYVTGDTGRIVTDLVADRRINWGAREQLGSVDTTAFVRVYATDSVGNKDTAASLEFTIDTKVPVFTATLSSTGKTSATIDLSWSSTATDGNFNHYEIWYGTNQTNVQNRSNAAEWDNDPDDASLASAAATTTTITGLLANTGYYLKIWAVDDYGNETTAADINVTTDATTTTQLTDISDNVMEERYPTLNYGSSSGKGGATAGSYRVSASTTSMRTLLKINNIDDIPAGATINSAILYSYCGYVAQTSNITIESYRVLRDWNAGTGTGTDQANMSNWNEYANENNWTTAGCDGGGTDRVATAITSATVGNTGWYTWTITQTFSDWHTGTNTNYGLVFKSTTEGTINTDKHFHSAEGANVPYLEVQYTVEPPEVTGPGDTTLVQAVQNDPDTVEIRYEVVDPNDATVTVSLQYKPSGGSWADATNTSGQIGAGISAIPGTRTINWDARTQLGSSIDGTYYVRVIASDGNLIDTTESEAFGLDTKAPEGLANFSVTDSSSYWIECGWDAVSSEGHFDHYEIWYGSDKSSVENRTASEYDGDDNNGLLDVATTSVTIYGLSPSTKYHFKIWAVDSMGNEATVSYTDSATTLQVPIPTVTGWNQAANVDASQINTTQVRIGFQVMDIDDDSANVTVQYLKVSGGSWTNATTLSGDTGWVTTGEAVQDTVTWGASTDLPGTTDEAYQVRVIAVDDTGFADTTASAQFSIDFVAPISLATLAVSAIDANTATLTWTAASDNNFSHYEIWYGTNQGDVQNRTGTANEWDNGNDANLTTITTATTIVTSLLPSSTYYFKIWAVDIMGNEMTIADVNDVTAASNDPVVTGPGSSAQLSAGQVNTSNVNIGYEVSDANSGTVTITAEYQVYNGSGWTAFTTTSGDIGAGIAVGTGKQIAWTASTDLPTDGAPEDSIYTVRVTANDAKERATHTAYSDTFTLDVQGPTGLGSFTPSDTLGTQITFTWDAVTERNFNHYEIWYGTNQSDVQNRTGTAVEWDNDDDATLTNKASTTSTITGLTVNTTYYWKIWAIDNIGNESTVADITVATKNMVTPAWSRTSMGIVKGGAVGEGVMYVGSGTAVYKLSCITLTDGSDKWTYSTSAYGDCNMPTYSYISGKYNIVASAGNYVIGRQDDGASSSELFTPINLGAAAGNPYISPDQATLYVVYGSNLTKRNLSDGSEVWTVAITNANKDADIVVFDDVVYLALTDGAVHKRNAADGSAGQTYDAQDNVSLPLMVQNGALFITPDNDTAYSVNSANMTIENWKTYLAAINTGAAFIDSGGTDIYLAVSDSVKKLNASTGAQSWSYFAGDTIESGPINYDGFVYFGRNSSRYYSITSAGAGVTKWPYTNISGDANTGPWIDEGNSRVIFATKSGNLDAFTLESIFGKAREINKTYLEIKTE